MKFYPFGDDPDLASINKRIHELEMRRRELLADKLLGRTRTQVGGMVFVTDPSIPPDELHLVDSQIGEVKAVIKNLSV